MLTAPSCPPWTTPCNVFQQHAGLWPHSRTIAIERFVRLIVATSGLTAHLLPRDGDEHQIALTDQLGTLAGIHQEGGYALAELLRRAESGRDHDNVTVIDLLDHYRQNATPATTITIEEADHRR